MSLNFFSHTISEYDTFAFGELKKLEKILKDGYLLSRRKLGLNVEMAAFNGMDYISLCDLSKEHEDYSAYNIYTKRGLSLLFDKSIKVIEPNYYQREIRDVVYFKKIHEMGLGKTRYSDLKDEVQVKNELSLEYLRGILLPYLKIMNRTCLNYANYYLDEIYSLLKQYNYDVPIINLDDEKVLTKRK